MIIYDTLKIYSYKARNGSFYKVAYYNNDFKFVHITKQKISTCAKVKEDFGKSYLLYEGRFDLTDFGTIEIY